MRAVAHRDHKATVQDVLDWPLAEVLVEYLEHVARPAAREAYEMDLVLWAEIAPHLKKPPPRPQPPKILESK